MLSSTKQSPALVVLDRGERPVCLSRENPNRLVSLWDIVNEFKAGDFALRAANFANLEVQFSNYQGTKSRLEHLAKLFDAQLGHAKNNCAEIGMRDAADWFEGARHRIEDQINPSVLSNEALHAKEAIVSELRKTRFLYILSDRAEYAEGKALFGKAVYDAFPSARADIQASGNCLACELPTASVFHLMRAVEWGLRALGADLGFRRLRSRNKKTGKIKYTPLPWAIWEDIIGQIKSRITERIAKARRGPKKQLYQEFYNPAIESVERFKDTYRNHVMHTRREYARAEAFAAFDQVRHFMTTLASRLSEC